MEKVQMNYQVMRENYVLPHPATEMSGGMDVTAAHIEVISEREVVVYLGLGMQPPPNYRIRFSPRSSFTKHDWVLQNSPALGDADFPGEYRIKFKAIPIGVDNITYAMEYPEFPYKVGDRVAQMWIEEIIPTNFVEAPFVNNTDRTGGFGSTNKK